MLTKTIKLINDSKKIAIFTHINSDGDALGSSIALKLGLEQLGKQVDLYCDDDIHENYNFLGIKDFYIEHKETSYDLAIIVDCSSIDRIGKYIDLYECIPNSIMIDHHLNNKIRSNATLLDEKAGSAGVIVYRLLKALNLNINTKIATAIYCAVASDTGSFMHTNTTAEIHAIASEMLKHNIDLEKINYYLFKRKTKAQMMLFVRALSNIQFHEDNQIAITVIDMDDYQKTGTSYTDTIGIANYIVGIDGVEVAVTLTESRDNVFLVSFRATKVDCSKIALHFNGGGHAKAAGCRICGKKENVINKILEVCKRELY